MTRWKLPTLVASLGLAYAASTAVAKEGEDLNVHNKTGHHVTVFLLQDDSPHLDPDEGVQFATLGDGESAVAHVPTCHFGILLVDNEDVWHAELHDCHSTELTFTKDTGHAKREHHKKH
jgi:hypothetical protein